MVFPFENNTTAAIRKLAAGRIRANKNRNMFVILAVVLTTVLFASLFVVAGGFLDQNKQVQQKYYGTAHAGIKFLTKEQLELLQASDLVKEVYYTRVVGRAVNEELSKLSTEVRYAQDGSARSFLCDPSVGTMPKEEDEIATSTLVLEAMGLPCELGTAVHLRISVDDVLYEKDFRLCGFWEGNERAEAQMAWVSETFADSIAPAAHQNIADSGKYGGIFCADLYFPTEWNIERQMNTLLVRLGEESGIYQLPISTNPSCGLGISMDTLNSIFVPAVFLLGIIVIVGYLIIYNMFSISVVQDVQFFGLLRTIGAGSRQIRNIVKRQAVRLALFGLPFGLAAGYVIGMIFLPYVLTQINMEVTGTYRSSPAVLIGAVLFSLLTVYISSIKPCKYAAKIAAVEAVRYTGGGSGVRIKGKRSRRFTPLSIAIRNVKRGGRKAALVIVSLSLSMILLNTTYTAVTGFDLETFINENSAADFCVSDYTVLHGIWPENLSGISNGLMQEIERIPGLEEKAFVYAKEIRQQVPDAFIKRGMQGKDTAWTGLEDAEKGLEEYHSTSAMIYGIDDALLDLVTISEGVVDESLWKSGKGVIVYDFYYESNGGSGGTSPLYRIGDDITITDEKGGTHDFKVMAAGKLNNDISAHYVVDLGFCVILPVQGYEEVYGKTQPLTAVFNVADQYREKAEEWICDYSSNVEKDLDYISYRTYEKEFQESKAAYTMIGTVLGMILALIGLLNFTNVTVTSLLARQKEMAVLGAAGMEKLQMKRMLIWEGTAYIGLAFLLTVTLGTGIVYYICEKFVGNIWAFQYRFTLVPAVLCLPFLLIVAVIVPLAFWQRMEKKSLVERLRAVE